MTAYSTVPSSLPAPVNTLLQNYRARRREQLPVKPGGKQEVQKGWASGESDKLFRIPVPAFGRRVGSS